MNEIINAIILGIIQGLTEFLPVSSDGHLELAKYFLGDQSAAKDSLMMTVILHVGTTLSIVVVFWKDIVRILGGLFQFKWNEETIFSMKVVVSMIPAAFVGLFFEKEIEQLFERQIVLTCICLFISGLLLWIASKSKRTGIDLTYGSAFVVGIAQAFAILPGLSRSGSTISTCVMYGIDREQATRFSFLMVVPLILGKIVKDLMSGDVSSSTPNLMPMLVGFVASFLTGLFACRLMIKLVKGSKLVYFSFYLFIVSIAVLIYYLTTK